MLRRIAPPLSLLALASLMFGAWMHWQVVDPRNFGWLLVGDDRGQSAAGTAAYLRAATGWPGLRQPLLASPEGMTLLFTDSIPLIGLLAKPFAAWLPHDIQFLGPWLLLCVVLQAVFGWLLLRPRAPDALSAWIGTALLVLMPMLVNRYGHASLCAQWLVLWALWVLVDPERSRRPLWWVAVLGVAAMIHMYLLLMVTGIWGSAMFARLWRETGRGRTLAGALPVVAVVAAILVWHGVFAGSYASTGTYGAFPMALDAWWNVANPGYTALLPASEGHDGRGYEGLQYLGAGLLALVVVAGVAVVRDRTTARDAQRLAWLVPVFAIVLIVAVGPQPYWRSLPLTTFALPQRIVDLLDPVRAAGRLMWPATYAIALAAILIVLCLRHATLVLAGALMLQIVDLAPMLAAVRATSAAAAEPETWRRTRDPRWQTLVERAGAVQFEPAEPFRDLAVLEEVAWRAIQACRPVRYYYASRESVATRARIDADTAAFLAGQVDPTRLYVLLDGHAPAALAGRVRRLDGIAIIPPTAPAPPPTCATASSPRSAS